MNNFVWHDFGCLQDVRSSDSMVFITNDTQQTLKMSRNKYKESATAVLQKAEALKGKNITVRTSQNTANWSTAEWFSDIQETP